MVSDENPEHNEGETGRRLINELAVEEASKEAKEHLKEIHSHKIKRKKHPSLTRSNVISAYARRCREAGMPPNEISAFVREQLDEEIEVKMVSNETIDNLPSDYKIQALSTRGKRGREVQLKRLNEINKPKTILPSQVCSTGESEAKSTPSKLPLPDSSEDSADGHSSRLDTVPQSHNENMASMDNEYGQNTSFVSTMLLPQSGKPSISFWR